MRDFSARVEPTPPERLKLHELLLKKKAQNVSKPQTIPRRAGDGPCPLSFAQQRLWFIDQLEGGSAFYNLPMAVRLDGPFDASAFRRALGEVVRRHESLRTTFVVVEDEPAQVISPTLAVALPVSDLSALPNESREAETRRLAAEEARLTFDLAAGPLLRARLLRLSAEEHVALFTIHHIVSDAWSKDILIGEVSTLYEAYSRGAESPLPELPVQYADYAAWQREWLRGETLEKQLSYWRGQLEGAPPVLELPTDRPRPPAPSHGGERLRFALPEGPTRALEELCRREGATPFMALLAAFQVLLARYTGQADVVVGTSIAGRGRLETEGLIGFFVNTLALRTDLSDDPTFAELLGRVRETCLGAYTHQDIPFEKLVEELRPERSLGHAPIFQVLFSFQNAPRKATDASGLRFMSVERRVVQFDLMLTMEKRGERLYGVFEYKTDLFDESTIRRMASHFEVLLAGIAEDAERRVSRLPLLADEERRRMLFEWNDTRRVFKGACAHKLFEEQAARTPSEMAVTFEDVSLTYAELDERADALARYLRLLSVGPEVRVAIFMGRSVEMVVSLLAVLKAGGCYVPLDPEYPLARLAYLLEDCGAAVVLTREGLLDLLPSHRAQEVCVDSEWEMVTVAGASVEAGEADAGPDPDHLAYVIYTSGSTGTPKGVMVTHGGLSNYLGWARTAYHLDATRGAPVHSPLAFDLTVTSLLLPLAAGACVTLLAEGRGVEHLAAALASPGGYGLVKLTPAHLEALGHALDAQAARGATRLLVVGGEALTGAALSWWGRHAPQVRVVNEYGPTETVVGCCVEEVRAAEVRAGAVPIGRPIANTRLYVLGRRGEAVPVGVAGELYIGGAQVARGYLNRAALTAERFVPDPFSEQPGARLYRTGDVAKYLADGRLEYVGRADEQVKVRGFRVELGEVEAALARHPRVGAAAVVVRGEGAQKQLVGYVVPPGGQSGVAGGEVEGGEGVGGEVEGIGGGELRRYLSERLPGHMVPSLFVSLDALPLTPNGKLDRKALPEPEAARRGSGGEHVAPRNPIEEALCAIWREVLGVERVGVEDNFFELGGHSLLATQVVSRIRQEHNVEVSLVSIFEMPTVGQLARAVEDGRQLEEAGAVITKAEQGSEDELLTKIEEFSEAELDSLLRGMMSETE